jgi:peroxiredoxin
VLGGPAPAYSARDLSGAEVSLADLEGRVVMLNVWATWCQPCLREMPGLERLHRAYEARGLHVVGVSIDRGSALAEVDRFMGEHGITYSVLHDPDQDVSSVFRTIGVPETFLIDREGVLVHRWIGAFVPDAPDVVARVEELLAGA